MAHAILIVTDDPVVLALIQEEARRVPGAELSVAGTRAEYLIALKAHEPDVIVGDRRLADFAGTEALAVARERCPEVPFVALADDITAEQALELVRAGASDVVLTGRMTRLVPALMQAIEERARRVRRRNEGRVQARRLEQLETIRDAAMALIASGELAPSAARLLSRALARNRGGGLSVGGETREYRDPVAEASAWTRTRARRPDDSVLVVEDDEDLRMLTALTLRRRGYKVLEAGSPGEAINALSNSPVPVRLLVTDIHMPAGSGLSLAARCRGEAPAMQVLVISADAETLSNIDPGLGYSIMTKPFSPEELAQRVYALLSEADVPA